MLCERTLTPKPSTSQTRARKKGIQKSANELGTIVNRVTVLYVLHMFVWKTETETAFHS